MQPVDRLELLQQALGRMDLSGDTDRLGAIGGVRTRVDRGHAFDRERGVAVDAQDHRVRVGASNEHGVQQAGRGEVGQELAFSSQQPIVLDPTNRLPDRRGSGHVASHRPLRGGMRLHRAPLVIGIRNPIVPPRERRLYVIQ